jgi:hypothetical protein
VFASLLIIQQGRCKSKKTKRVHQLMHPLCFLPMLVFLAAPPLQDVVTCNCSAGIDEHRTNSRDRAPVVGDNTNDGIPPPSATNLHNEIKTQTRHLKLVKIFVLLGSPLLAFVSSSDPGMGGRINHNCTRVCDAREFDPMI